MSEVFDLYGSRELSLGEVAAVVEKLAAVALQERDRQARGGQYFLGGEVGGEECRVHLNRDEDPEPLEPEYPAHCVLLEVSRSERADALKVAFEKVVGLDFLRRIGR